MNMSGAHQGSGPSVSARRAYETVTYWARVTSEAKALVSGDHVISYGQLYTLMQQTARRLEQLGLRPGDRIMLVAENSYAVPVLMLGAQYMDAWPCIVNGRISAREMAALQGVVEPRLVVFVSCESSGASDFAEALAATGQDFGDVGNLDVAVLEATPEPVHESAAEQTGLIIFTSGTTGLPKAARLSHAALLDVGATLAQVRKVRHGGQYDGSGPLSHVMGLCTLLSALHGGASLAFSRRVDIPELVKRIASGRTTHLSFVPTLYTRLVEYIRVNGVDLSQAKLEYISCGGAPLDPLLKQEVERLFRVRLVNGYGMTECFPITRTTADRDYAHDSIGYAEPGAAIRIVRDDGSDAGPGEVGELWARAVGQMQGYYRNPDATAEALRDGDWVATGDLATRATDGEIRIAGRKKEMIIRSGFNVYPAEVENVLNAHPEVLFSAVVGNNLGNGDEEVVAFVQLVSGSNLQASDLTPHLRAALAPYKVPSQIFVRSQLPMGSTGKILKRQLVEELAQTAEP